jgi:hypothetical protein
LYGWPEDAKFFVPEGVYDHFRRPRRAPRRWIFQVLIRNLPRLFHEPNEPKKLNKPNDPINLMPDIAIKIEGLSKVYRIGTKQERYKTLRESIMSAVTAPFHRFRSAGQSELDKPNRPEKPDKPKKPEKPKKLNKPDRPDKLEKRD